MAQQTIDLGAAPNDRTGDALRDAYDKCNLNFTELYAILPTPLSKLTQSGASSGQYPSWNGAAWVPATLPVATNKDRADFCFYDATANVSSSVLLADNGLPAPDPTDYAVYRCNFNPTNFALVLWAVTGENSGGTFGWALQYSLDAAAWTSVSSSTLNVDNKSSEFVQISGSITVTGYVSVVYFRLIYINTTGNDRAYAVKAFTISVWD